MNKEILTAYCNAYLELVADAKLLDAIKYAVQKERVHFEPNKKEIEAFKKYYYRYRINNNLPLRYKKILKNH